MKIIQFLLVIFVFANIVNAQNDNEKLNLTNISSESGVLLKGLTMDEIGAVIPHSVVNLIGTDGNIIKTKANDKGEYAIKLAPGEYKIFAESKNNSVLLNSKNIKIEIKLSAEITQDLILYCADTEKCPPITTFYCG